MNGPQQTSPRPGSIVVGIDDSEGAGRALAWAAEQAQIENRPLTILHSAADAVLRNTVFLDAQGIDHIELARELRAVHLQVLERAAAGVASRQPGMPVDAVLVDVDPRTALVEASVRAHLLVVGSRGRGLVSSVLLGSVSRHVAAHASCPVVVCRDGAHEPAPGGHGPARTGRGIIVGVDWTAASVPVAEFAFQQASLHGEPLTVMHAGWHLPSALTDRPLSAVDDHEGIGEMLGESIAGLREKYPDVRVFFELRRGLADEVLARATPEGRLVVVGRPPHDLATRVLDGQTALAVVEQAHGPVAVVPVPAS